MTLLEHFNACDYNGGPWSTIGDDLQYRLEVIDGTQYLSFQATNSKTDWKHNFMAWIVSLRRIDPYRGCQWKCHAGYAHVWRSANDAIFAMIDPAKPLVIRGYSKGADIAILAHEDAVWRGYTVESYTFGASAIVSGDFKTIFGTLTRIWVRGDIVAIVWPWFKHVGFPISLGKQAFPSPLKHRQIEYRKGLS